jgi:hypothetical protein
MGDSIFISEHVSVRPAGSILLPELAHKNNPPVTSEDSRKKERLFIFYDLIVDCQRAFFVFARQSLSKLDSALAPEKIVD